MIMNSIDTQPPFVIAALLAGRLYRMLETAKTMSISSSNAKCISIRGGTKTVGFKPLSDFISDMAKDTISISSKISYAALQFSITAVNEKRTLSALHDFNQVINRLPDQDKKDSLNLIINELKAKLRSLSEDQIEYCLLLNGLFDDIAQRIRAAKIIVINSRTEASRAEEYQNNLFSIADNLETCSEDIANEIKACKIYLENLTDIIEKK